jgi:hypothetical protein
VDFDYSYLDSCATGSSHPYLHDVSNESSLETALSEIATDLKSFANYTPAQNVK